VLPISVLLFQTYFNDSPIREEDLLFMDDCCVISSNPTATGL
jgi:hypothetical protein